MPDQPRTACNGISVEFEISQLMEVPLMTHASGTRLYISERLSSLILQDGLARLMSYQIPGTAPNMDETRSIKRNKSCPKIHGG